MILLKNNNSNIHNTNHSNNQVLTLSPLFSNSNTKSIAPINARISGGGRANITFANNAANTPAITIGTNSRSIAHFFMDDDNGGDDLGIRVSGSSLSYASRASSGWTGAGIINKPIGDFFTRTFNNSVGTFVRWAIGNDAVQVVANTSIITQTPRICHDLRPVCVRLCVCPPPQPAKETRTGRNCQLVIGGH